MIKTQIIGNIGGDAELKTTNEGKSIVNFSVAVTDGYGEGKKTVWFRCSAFGERWLKIQQFLKKGTKVYVEGKENPTIFEGKEGYMIGRNIYVNDIVLLGGGSEQPTTQTNSATPTQQFQEKTGIAPNNVMIVDGDDQDLPF